MPSHRTITEAENQANPDVQNEQVAQLKAQYNEYLQTQTSWAQDNRTHDAEGLDYTLRVYEGDIAFLQHNYTNAITAFSKAIELEPEEAKAYEFRGLAYHENDRDEKAFKDFEQVLKLFCTQPKSDIAPNFKFMPEFNDVKDEYCGNQNAYYFAYICSDNDVATVVSGTTSIELCKHADSHSDL